MIALDKFQWPRKPDKIINQSESTSERQREI